LTVIRCSHTIIRDEDWCRSSVFHTYIIHEEKNYKLIIDGGNCANVIAKKAIEKMGLEAEHPHLYNLNWIDKTAQFITQNCQAPIHMSSYEVRVWCDVLT